VIAAIHNLRCHLLLKRTLVRYMESDYEQPRTGPELVVTSCSTSDGLIKHTIVVLYLFQTLNKCRFRLRLDKQSVVNCQLNPIEANSKD